MKKAIKFLSVALATVLAAGFVSCTKDATETTKTDVENEGGSYISLNVIIPTSAMTKADADDSGEYEYGDASEYGVNTVYLYVFNGDTYVKKVELTGFQKSSSMSANPPASLTDYEVWTNRTPSKVSGLATDTEYTVYALVNQDVPDTTNISTPSDLESAQLAAISEKIDEIPTDGIPMSSRTDKGVLTSTLTITSAAASESTPATCSVVVERSYAKLSFAATNSNAYTLHWIAKDATSNSIATVTLDSLKLVNLATNNYVFRHVGKLEVGPVLSNLGFGAITKTYPETLDAAGDVASEGDTAYVIVPDYAEYTTSNYSTRDFLFDDEYVAIPTSTSYTTLAYSFENAMYKEYQAEGYVTGVIFSALVRPDSLRYMNGTSLDTATVADDNLHLALGTLDSLYYVGGRFYGSLEALQEETNAFASITRSNMASFGVKDMLIVTPDGSSNVHYGRCYYKGWIRHFNNGIPTIMGASEYSIVRNNVYKMSVTNIYSVGDGSDDKDPDQPIESEEYYLTLNVDIKPWIVRTNEFEF